MSEVLKPHWIDTPDGIREAADRCAAAKRIALDTEADSMHSYFHKVCMIQVSANGHNMVIDPLAVRPADLRPLWEVVGNRDVPVLMHGADYDVRILDRLSRLSDDLLAGAHKDLAGSRVDHVLGRDPSNDALT